MFIVFEGIDGCGKSTVSQLFANRLMDRSVDNSVVLTKEPSDYTSFGKDTRDLLKKHDAKISNLTELLLFYANRIDHIQNVILKSLRRGKIVISDRYYYSSFAYQGVYCRDDYSVRDIHNAIFDALYAETSKTCEPDIIFWIDADVDTCINRNKKADSKDRMPKSYYDKCRAYYERLRSNKKTEVFKINGNQSLEDVVNEVEKIYDEFCQTH